MSTTFETGYIFSVPRGKVEQIEFDRVGALSAWRVKNGKASWLNGSHEVGTDLFLTRAEAVKAAEAARIKKLASLRKQIAKLEKTKFSEEA